MILSLFDFEFEVARLEDMRKMSCAHAAESASLCRFGGWDRVLFCLQPRVPICDIDAADRLFVRRLTVT